MYETNKFCGHSFRIGAATSAASSGVADHVIQSLGRWSSDCYIRYIRTDPKVLNNGQYNMCLFNSVWSQYMMIMMSSLWYISTYLYLKTYCKNFWSVNGFQKKLVISLKNNLSYTYQTYFINFLYYKDVSFSWGLSLISHGSIHSIWPE